MNSPINPSWQNAMTQGIAHLQQGRINPAVDCFLQAVSSEPDNAGGWINLCTAQIMAGLFTDAVNSAQKAITLAPDMAAAHIMLGDALRELGNKVEAQSAYRKAVELDRNPLALNRLGCAIREENQLDTAVDLFKESLQKLPGFPTAQVNLVTTYMLLEDFHKAREVVQPIDASRYPPVEKTKINEAKILIDEYFRLEKALADFSQEAKKEALIPLLEKTPEGMLQLHSEIDSAITRLCRSAKAIYHSSTMADFVSNLESWQNPSQWPEIEGLFMIPLISSAQEFIDFDHRIAVTTEQEKVIASKNMKAVIEAMRLDKPSMGDALQTELALRHWHILATQNLPGYLPGHFKYSGNHIGTDKAISTTEPVQTVQTLRTFISREYSQLPAGLARAALVLFTVAEVHPFPDGNGRIAMAWMNRELEWAGLPPAIFTRATGLLGDLADALKVVRRNPDDISPLYHVISAGQVLTQQVCAELTRLVVTD